jgi:hypothetical protein
MDAKYRKIHTRLRRMIAICGESLDAVVPSGGTVKRTISVSPIRLKLKSKAFLALIDIDTQSIPTIINVHTRGSGKDMYKCLIAEWW